MKKLPFFLTFAMVAFTANTWAQKNSVPEGWHRVKACEFSFILPNDVIQRKVQGIDSCVAEFVGKNIAVQFESGFYRGPNKPSEDDKDYKTSPIKISGKAGELVTYYNDWENPETKAQDKIWYADIYLVIRRTVFFIRTVDIAVSFSVSHYESADPEVVKKIYQSLAYSS